MQFVCRWRKNAAFADPKENINKQDTVDNEREIVLKFYEEVRERESLNHEKKILP